MTQKDSLMKLLHAIYQGTPSAVDVGQISIPTLWKRTARLSLWSINREFNESQINYGKRIRIPYDEISEEFRLFHNLYHDNRETDKYIKIDDEGNEHRVDMSLNPNHIQIRLKELRQFLAIKEMYLSISIPLFNEFSKYSLQEHSGLSEDKILNSSVMRNHNVMVLISLGTLLLPPRKSMRASKHLVY